MIAHVSPRQASLHLGLQTEYWHQYQWREAGVGGSGAARGGREAARLRAPVCVRAGIRAGMSTRRAAGVGRGGLERQGVKWLGKLA